MKAASDAYKASMKSQMRNQSFAKVVFGNVDTSAATDGIWSDNGVEPYSETDTVDFAFSYPKTYATLELNRWSLDGEQDLIPSSHFSKQGIVSSKMSNADGSFSDRSILTRAFNLDHTFPGITLTFDTRCNEHPLSIIVYFYYKGTVVDTQTVASVTDIKAEIMTTALLVDKVSVEVTSALPYHRPRIEMALYGIKLTFTGKNLLEVHQKNDVDPLSRRLPNESFSFSIHDYEKRYDPDNPTGIYSYIDVRSPITIQYGYELSDKTIEWLKPDNYVLNGKPTVANKKATFKGTGLIGSMGGTYYKGTFGRKSFHEMAISVLMDAGLTLTESGSHPWQVDDALKTMYCDAPLPVDTHMNCLQLIAHACRCRLYTDDDNIIHIKPFGVNIIGIYSGKWSDNGGVQYSEWDSVDLDNPKIATYVTLELNRWSLDGKQDIIPTTQYMNNGFVSSIESKTDGKFDVTPVVTRMFDVSHDLPVVGVRFDTQCGEYPSVLCVRYYRAGKIVLTKNITKIEGTELLISTNVVDCDKFDISFVEMLPNRRPRIERVFYRETDFVLNFSSIAKDSQVVKKIDELRGVSVNIYSHTGDGNNSVLYDGVTDETNLHVEFASLARNATVTVSGGTLVSAKFYAKSADIALSKGTKSIKISGEKMVQTKVSVEKIISQSGEMDEEKNPLITNEEMRKALADHTASYLAMRNTYDSEYRGNPEVEVGDLIRSQTNYTAEMDALVLVDELNFSGALSGKLKVKGIL